MRITASRVLVPLLDRRTLDEMTSTSNISGFGGKWLLCAEMAESGCQGKNRGEHQDQDASLCDSPILSSFCPVVIPPVESYVSSRRRFRKRQYIG